MTNLKVLQLGKNLLTGTVPAALGELSALRTLYLIGNTGLSGALPYEWGVPTRSWDRYEIGNFYEIGDTSFNTKPCSEADGETEGMLGFCYGKPLEP